LLFIVFSSFFLLIFHNKKAVEFVFHSLKASYPVENKKITILDIETRPELATGFSCSYADNDYLSSPRFTYITDYVIPSAPNLPTPILKYNRIIHY